MRRLLTLAGAALALAVAAPPADAARPLTTGFFDGVFAAPAAERDPWLDRAVTSGAGMIRVDIGWSASRRPARPEDPADPAYDFSRADDAVAAARARGLQVLIAFTGAPAWAEGPGRPANAPTGSWRPDPAAVGAYGQALARRYAGAVSHFQVWNEPNLDKYLSPQWTRREGRWIAAAPAHYRRMLNAFYSGVKAAQPGAVVVTAGTGPFGDFGHGRRIMPAKFVRELLRQPVSFDALSHHPYSVGGPSRRARNDDDVSIPDLHKLERPLRAAERRGTALPRGVRHRLWVTELGYDSSPPDPDGVPAATQARWLSQALSVLWLQGVDTALWYLVRDLPPEPSFAASSQSGVFLRDGRAKPAQRAFRFPLAVRRTRSGRLRVWLRSPVAGRLRVQQRLGGRWRTRRSVPVTAGQVVDVALGHAGGDVRADVGAERSLIWSR